VWTALLAAVAGGKVNADPYDLRAGVQAAAGDLTLYENGVPAMAGVPVNTGAPGADTVDGTYPVFEHVTSSRMQGTNPDGSHLRRPRRPVGQLLQRGRCPARIRPGHLRLPQSNGCVEMPVATAALVWPLTPIGTLVTVVGPPS
jgi:hypothetical protein